MIRISLALVAAISLSACTSVKHMPLSPEGSAKLQGRAIARTQYTAPDFSAFTAGKAAFGMFGAAAMVSEGNEIVKTNEIADPAIAISAGLADRIAAARGVTVAVAETPAKTDKVEDLVKVSPASDFLLDVKTFGWMFNYYPTDWAHYKVTYSARLRLIDAASKKVLAESMCQTVQGDDANPPTKEQLLENKAALLKDYLSKATNACVDVLAKDVLRI